MRIKFNKKIDEATSPPPKKQPRPSTQGDDLMVYHGDDEPTIVSRADTIRQMQARKQATRLPSQPDSSISNVNLNVDPSIPVQVLPSDTTQITTIPSAKRPAAKPKLDPLQQRLLDDRVYMVDNDNNIAYDKEGKAIATFDEEGNLIPLEPDRPFAPRKKQSDNPDERALDDFRNKLKKERELDDLGAERILKGLSYLFLNRPDILELLKRK